MLSFFVGILYCNNIVKIFSLFYIIINKKGNNYEIIYKIRSDMVKKPILFIVVILLTLSLISCSKSKSLNKAFTAEKQEIVSDSILTIADYFPVRENTMKEYEGIGNEFAEKKTFVEFYEDGKVQIKEENPGTTFVRVLEYKDGELREIYAEGEFYHIENMLNANTNRNNILLKEPIEIGNSWTNDDGSIKEITSLNERVETSSGTYEALEVTTRYQSGDILKEYYAKDIGLVASIYEQGGNVVKTLLKEIKNTPKELTVEAYYPTKNKIGTGYVDQIIMFETNDDVREILESILKNPPNDKLIPSISKDVKINEIHLNRESWILEIDFSKEFTENFNVGSAQEAEMLKSLVNTLGKFYDVDKVFISIEGKPYESGHFAIRDGEFFKVDTSDSVKIE